MTISPAVSRRLLFATLIGSAVVGMSPLPAVAQSPILVQPLPDPNSPVEQLGRYIRILAGNPRDLGALLGAGQAALDVGDANAALGFYARAEEVSPSNGQVKAGLGSSLVMIERPDDALRLFAQAVEMGVPEAAIARDRGLAYDLRGDSRRAQRDYALAVTRRGAAGDDELVRRYALSLGISGDRTAALAMLDPLLRRQDQGAWRARSFVMAMTGDVSGANAVARQLMVPAMASAMSPLLSRLATLNPAERAHAVNFGTVPADGTQLAVQTGDPFLGSVARAEPAPPLVSAAGLSRAPVRTGDAGLIPAGEPLGPRPKVATPARVALATPQVTRRSSAGEGSASIRGTQTASATVVPSAPTPVPGFTPAPDMSASTSRRLGERIGGRIGPVDPARLPPELADNATPSVIRVVGTFLPPPDARAMAGSPVVNRAAATPLPQSASVAATPTPVADAPFETPPLPSLPAKIVRADPAPSVVAEVSPPIARAPSAPVEITTPAPSPAATSRLAGLLAGLEPEAETAVVLPNAAELRAARAAARKKMAQLAAQAAAEDAAKREKAEKEAATKRNPARIWVQVATGRNDSGLGITLRRIRSANETALKGLGGWVAPYKATNRILVGPIKSASAARDLIGKLAKTGVSAMTFNSDPGEEIEKIDAK